MIKLESSIIHLAASRLEGVVPSLLGKVSRGKCEHRMPLFELLELMTKDFVRLDYIREYLDLLGR